MRSTIHLIAIGALETAKRSGREMLPRLIRLILHRSCALGVHMVDTRNCSSGTYRLSVRATCLTRPRTIRLLTCGILGWTLTCDSLLTPLSRPTTTDS